MLVNFNSANSKYIYIHTHTLYWCMVHKKEYLILIKCSKVALVSKYFINNKNSGSGLYNVIFN
jgi:hypothetical protein